VTWVVLQGFEFQCPWDSDADERFKNQFFGANAGAFPHFSLVPCGGAKTALECRLRAVGLLNCPRKARLAAIDRFPAKPRKIFFSFA
jgi:hypothetical protein